MCWDVRSPRLRKEVHRLRKESHELRTRLRCVEEECDRLNGSKALHETALTRLYECKICMDAPIQCVFLPCGHGMSCFLCAKRVVRCPVCQVEYDRLATIHMM